MQMGGLLIKSLETIRPQTDLHPKNVSPQRRKLSNRTFRIRRFVAKRLWARVMVRGIRAESARVAGSRGVPAIELRGYDAIPR